MLTPFYVIIAASHYSSF